MEYTAKYENMYERLRMALRDTSQGIRRAFFDHYYSFDSNLKTYIRMLASELGEHYTCDNSYYETLVREIEEAVDRDLNQNKKIVLSELMSIMNSRAFTDQDMRDIFMIANHVIDYISEDYENNDMNYAKESVVHILVFNILPYKFEEYSLFNFLVVDIYDFNPQSMISHPPYDNIINKYLLEYFDKIKDIMKYHNSYESIAALIVLTLRSIMSDPLISSKVYLYFIRLHADIFSASEVKKYITKFETEKTDTLDLIKHLGNITDVADDVRDFNPKPVKVFEGDFTDVISLSTNDLQIFGDAAVLENTELENDFSKLEYKIEQLVPEEIVQYFGEVGEECRIDFELDERMMMYLKSQINPQTLVIRSRNNHIRRTVARINDKIFLLFRIYNDSDHIYGITVLSSKDIDGEECRDTLVIKMDDSDYELKAGDIYGNDTDQA